MIWLLLAAILGVPAAVHAAQPVAILIPGTVNSWVPGGNDEPELRAYPYFSKAVVDTVRAEGYEAHVVTGLDPFGAIESNGKKALADLSAWYRERHPSGDAPITLIGHSAGGLYALYAAAHAEGLPIRKVILVATPLAGARLADFIERGGRGAQRLWDALLKYRPYLDLRGLREMRPAAVAAFLSRLRLDPELAVYAVGGSQPLPRGPLQEGDPDFLSPPFALAGRAIGVESDGIVERVSAYAEGAALEHEIIFLPDEHADLEHAEQFMDWRLLGFFGTRNASVIEARQRGFYRRILRAAR